jgi:hypothetical protein
LFLSQQTVIDTMSKSANEAKDELLALFCTEDPWQLGVHDAQPMFQFARDGTGYVGLPLLKRAKISTYNLPQKG